MLRRKSCPFSWSWRNHRLRNAPVPAHLFNVHSVGNGQLHLLRWSTPTARERVARVYIAHLRRCRCCRLHGQISSTFRSSENAFRFCGRFEDAATVSQFRDGKNTSFCMTIVLTIGVPSYFQIMTWCGMESLWEVTWLITICPSSFHCWTSESLSCGDLWITATSGKCSSFGHQIRQERPCSSY